MPTLQTHLCIWACRQGYSDPEGLIWTVSSSQRTLVRAEGLKGGAQVAAVLPQAESGKIDLARGSR